MAPSYSTEIEDFSHFPKIGLFTEKSEFLFLSFLQSTYMYIYRKAS